MVKGKKVLDHTSDENNQGVKVVSMKANEVDQMHEGKQPAPYHKAYYQEKEIPYSPPSADPGNPRPVMVLGNLAKPKAHGEPKTLEKFKRIKSSRKGWIEMNEADVRRFEKLGVLAGYDADEGLGLLKEETE